MKGIKPVMKKINDILLGSIYVPLWGSFLEKDTN